MAIDNLSQEESNRRNLDHCKSIANDLYTIATGHAYKEPEYGELVYLDEDEDAPEDYEQADMLDYFSDALDIQYTVGQDRKYRGARLLVTCDGPNIYVDTITGAVELYWWSDQASYPLDRCTVEAIDEIASELWEMGA